MKVKCDLTTDNNCILFSFDSIADTFDTGK